MHTVNALHDRQVKIRYHWADIAPLQSVDIDDEGEVNISVTASLHQALGINAIVNSIRELSSLMSDKKQEDDDERPSKRLKLSSNDADSETDDKIDENSENELENHDSRFGSAFVKTKTSSNVNKPLADMMSMACTSTADSDFDIREKYNRPSYVPFLLVPTVKAYT